MSTTTPDRLTLPPIAGIPPRVLIAESVVSMFARRSFVADETAAPGKEREVYDAALDVLATFLKESK